MVGETRRKIFWVFSKLHDSASHYECPPKPDARHNPFEDNSISSRRQPHGRAYAPPTKSSDHVSTKCALDGSTVHRIIEHSFHLARRQGTVTEILYGQSFRLPGEFIGSHRSNDSTNNHVEFVRQLYQHIRNLRPISDASRHNKGNIFVFKDFAPSEQVLYDTRWSQAATSTAIRRAEQSRKAIGENVRRQHKRSRFEMSPFP